LISGNATINNLKTSIIAGGVTISQASSTASLYILGEANSSPFGDFQNNGQLIIRNFNQTRSLAIGYDTTNDIAIIQSLQPSIAGKNLCFNPAGGNIGINTTTPQYNLDVSGTINTNNLITINSTISNLNTTNFIASNLNVSNLISNINTTGSLNITNNVALNANMLYIKGAMDANHQIRYDGPVIDGPRIIGNGGVTLGRYNGGSIIYDLVSNGNGVGIGTTNPQFKLDVSGTINTNVLLTQSSSIATLSTNIVDIRNRMALNSNVLYVKGSDDPNHQLAWSALNDGPRLLGNFGVILGRYNGGTIQNHLVTTSSGNVGINTINPQYTLDVNGTINASTGLFNNFIANTISSNSLVIPFDTGKITTNLTDNFLYDGFTVSNYGLSWNNDPDSSVGAECYLSGFGSIKLFTTSQPRFIIDQVGNIGIGTTKPNYKLDVLGTINATNLISGNATINNLKTSIIAGGVTISQASSTASLYILGEANSSPFGDFQNNGQLIIRNFNQSRSLAIGYDTTNDIAIIQSLQPNIAAKNLCFNPAGGNIGINTTNPQYNLDINGTMNVNINTTGSLNITNNIALNANMLYIKGAMDANHQISYDGSVVDGPQILGNSGVALGRYNGGSIQYNLVTNSNGVGINMNNPQYTLDVNGTIHVNNAIINISTINNLIVNTFNTNSIITNTLSSKSLVIPFDTGKITTNLGDNFLYDGFTVSNYGLSWNNDPDSSAGAECYLSGFGSIKLFTTSQPRFIIDQVGNIGIGTTKPNYKLDVLGTINANNSIFSVGTTGSLNITNNVALNSNMLYIKGAMDANHQIRYDGPVIDGPRIIGNGGVTLGRYNGGNIIYDLVSNGNGVGIGTTNPQFKLDVSGTINATNLISGNATLSNLQVGNESVSNIQIGTGNINTVLALNDNPIFARNSGDPNHQLSFNSNIDGIRILGNSSIALGRFNNGNPQYDLFTNINGVGIGTSNPLYKLHVTGTVFTPTLLSSDGTISNLLSNSILANTLKVNNTISNLAIDALDITSKLQLNRKIMYIAGSNDKFHQLSYDPTLDGPVLSGFGSVGIGRYNGSSVSSFFVVGSNGNINIGGSSSMKSLQVTGTSQGSISIRNSGDVRYHLYNNGGITEWVFGQSSSTNHGLSFSKLNNGNEINCMELSATSTPLSASWNTTNTVLFVSKDNTTGRSINAGGTVNVNGADYAEYIYKQNPSATFAKGDIVGINNIGKITNLFSESFTFFVKSTNPGLIGGDNWADNVIKTTEEQYLIDLENERQKVDRVGFSGIVPVNVIGASVGDYIIPVQGSDDKIKGISINKNDITFGQYQSAVGKVISILQDSRANIIVKSI
jgi:hypothetical protein